MIKIGDIVKIKQQYTDHGFDIGEKVIITDINEGIEGEELLASPIWNKGIKIPNYEYEGRSLITEEYCYFWEVDVYPSIKEILEKL